MYRFMTTAEQREGVIKLAWGAFFHPANAETDK